MPIQFHRIVKGVFSGHASPIYYFAIIIIIFSLVLAITYIAANPPERSLSSVNYPYYLSVKPALGAKGGQVNIFASFLDGRTEIKNIDVLVVDPFGEVYEYKLKDKRQTLKFPKDFANDTTTYEGSYSVVLVSRMTNQNLVELNFSIVPGIAPLAPMFHSFGGFALGNGLPITIGLLVAVITTVYQFASARSGDRNRQKEDRAKWMIDNCKYYWNMVDTTKKVYQCLEVSEGKFRKDYRNREEEEILYGMVRFYHAYTDFKDHTSMFYFDDPHAETFLASLRTMLFDVYGKAIGENDITNLKKIVGLEKIQMKENVDCKKYCVSLSDFLKNEKEEKDKCDKYELKPRGRFYALHLVFSLVLEICINAGFIGTYSSANRIEREVVFTVEPYVNNLPYYMEYVNCKIFGESRKHDYKLTYNNKDLLKNKKNRLCQRCEHSRNNFYTKWPVQTLLSCWRIQRKRKRDSTNFG